MGTKHRRQFNRGNSLACSQNICQYILLHRITAYHISSLYKTSVSWNILTMTSKMAIRHYCGHGLYLPSTSSINTFENLCITSKASKSDISLEIASQGLKWPVQVHFQVTRTHLPQRASAKAVATNGSWQWYSASLLTLKSAGLLHPAVL